VASVGFPYLIGGNHLHLRWIESIWIQCGEIVAHVGACGFGVEAGPHLFGR
jgi:hypothetical protein